MQEDIGLIWWMSRSVLRGKEGCDGMEHNNKVSIITPSYNCEKYIEKTIASVQKQTYSNWEMIIVDDYSSDDTRSIIERIAEKDDRIRILYQQENLGAAKARNLALSHIEGRFVAYLDADDLWHPQKLEKQVLFMLEHRYGFTCASYEVIADDGRSLNKFIRMPVKLDYIGFLTNNILQTVGIMVDTVYVKKDYLIMPDMRRRQDAATWLQILKSGVDCYGIDEILALYRRTEGSLSSNKWKAAKGVWSLYRNTEHLSLPFSWYCFVKYALLAVWKRIYV